VGVYPAAGLELETHGSDSSDCSGYSRLWLRADGAVCRSLEDDQVRSVVRGANADAGFQDYRTASLFLAGKKMRFIDAADKPLPAGTAKLDNSYVQFAVTAAKGRQSPRTQAAIVPYIICRLRMGRR